MIKIKGIES